MDAEVRNELEKIAASLAVIETRLGAVETEQRVGRETRSEFPPMPFPAFDQGSTSLPI